MYYSAREKLNLSSILHEAGFASAVLPDGKTSGEQFSRQGGTWKCRYQAIAQKRAAVQARVDRVVETGSRKSAFSGQLKVGPRLEREPVVIMAGPPGRATRCASTTRTFRSRGWSARTRTHKKKDQHCRLLAGRAMRSREYEVVVVARLAGVCRRVRKTRRAEGNRTVPGEGIDRTRSRRLPRGYVVNYAQNWTSRARVTSLRSGGRRRANAARRSAAACKHSHRVQGDRGVPPSRKITTGIDTPSVHQYHNARVKPVGDRDHRAVA